LAYASFLHNMWRPKLAESADCRYWSQFYPHRCIFMTKVSLMQS